MTGAARGWRRSSILVLAAIAGGCSLLPASTVRPVEQLPVGVEVTYPPSQLRLELANGTTIPVVLLVNDGAGRRVEPGGSADLGQGDLGPPPWEASVRTVSGRLLLELAVRPGDVAIRNEGGGGSSARGVGRRVDLSCGRIDLWSGGPMMGPAPGPGTPGDCDP